MKKTIIRMLKNLCYFILFFDMQVIAEIFISICYAVQLGMKEEAFKINTDELASQVTIFMEKNISWIVILSAIGTILFLVVLFKIRKKKFFEEISGIRLPFDKSVYSVLLGGGLAVMIGILLQIIPIPHNILKNYIQSAEVLTQSSIGVILFANVICAPIVEEIIFRGIIFSRAEKIGPLWFAFVQSAFLFAILHGQVLWIIYAFVLGIFLALIKYKTGSVYASILTHMAFNLVGLLGEKVKLTPITIYVILIISMIGSGLSLYKICIEDEKFEKNT